MTLDGLHSLLRRQLKRQFGDAPDIPPEWQGFVEAVNAAYREFDDDRLMLERSLDLSSNELLHANSEIRAFLHALPDLLFRLEQDGTIIDIKAGAHSELWLDRGKFLGKRIQDIPVRNIGRQFQEAIQSVLQTRSEVTLEYALTAGGRESHHEARLAPLHENQIVAIIRNITDRKKAENQLRHTISLLQSTFDSTADGLLVANREGRMVSFNERFGTLWRIPKDILESGNEEAALACAVTQLKDPDQFLSKVRELYASPNAESFDILEFKDGRVFERYSCPQRLDGVAIGRVWSFRDVTGRKQSEESVLKLSRVVDQTADAVLITDSTGVIEYANPAFEALTGYAAAEIIGKTPSLLKSGKHDDEVYKRLWQTILGNRVFRGTLINRKKNGVLFYSEKTITPIKDASGRITHFVSTENDISERRQLEEQLRQSQKMEAFGQLAAGVAHDFNNILTVILGNIAMVQGSEFTGAEMTAALAQAGDAAERAANLTRQLLTFSRRQPLQPTNLDLNEVVANMTKMLQRLIGEHIALEAHYSPGGAPVQADPGMMEQAIMNLAVNSRDAMPKGGRLILQTAAVTLDETFARSRPAGRQGNFVRLSISDTGEGIAPENLPHIFEPFFTTKEVGKGTGLGLATVFGIVEQHHGWIDVESQVNTGTTFHVYLPRLTGDTESQSLQERSALGLNGTETILLVEDETSVRQYMQKLLERHGYHVHSAASGQRALKVWREHHDAIDLLVTDMVMPEGLNGRELADRLRAERPTLKVIFVSGYTDDMLGKDSPLRARENFIEKPFESVEFLERIRSCVKPA